MIRPLNKFVVFRDAEGEGGGGGGTSDADKRFDALEERLGKLTSVLGGMVRQQTDDKNRNRISARETEIEAAITTADAAVGVAEGKVREAYENGESSEIAAAQRELTEAIASREVAKADKRTFEQAKIAAEKKTQQPPDPGDKPDTTNLDAWKRKHQSWYGVDDDMTQSAHAFDRQIRAAGAIPVGSTEYFEAIDRQMRQKYPDRMGGSPDTDGGRTTPTSDTRRSTRIPASVAQGYRRMGINIDDPEVAKRMLKNREAAVAKGILPEKPVTERIVT